MKGRKEILWIRTQLSAAIEISLIQRGDEIYTFSEYWPMRPQTININNHSQYCGQSQSGQLTG